MEANGTQDDFQVTSASGEKMLQIALANLQAMTGSIPLEISVPILVFALVLLFAFCLVVRMSKRRPQNTNDFVLALQAPAAYRIPDTYGTMEFSQKRVVTIKNLYLNHGLDLEEIARVLELDRASVQDVLAKSEHLHRKAKA